MAAMGAKASSPKKADDCGFNINSLPEELLMQVLIFVPPADVVKRCPLVCKYWRRVARDQTLWRRKCVQAGFYVPELMGQPPENFIVFYFRNPYTRNLLKNTTAQSLSEWQYEHGSPSIKVETSPAGADPIANHVPAEEIAGRKVQNWVSSYRMAVMSQKVKLLDKGCSEAVLDDLRPPIHISAWCTARWDCGAQFHVGARLLDKKEKLMDEVQKNMELVSEDLRKVWHKVEHVITDYKPGVRFVVFYMGGVDTQFWAGNYGPKFTLPCMRFVFNK